MLQNTYEKSIIILLTTGKIDVGIKEKTEWSIKLCLLAVIS